MNQKKILAMLDEKKDPAFEAKVKQEIDAISSYYDGGIEAYVEKGRVVLDEFLNNTEKELEITPALNKLRLDLCPEYERIENIGADNISKVAFVLVAGGLGERLGSSQIKISLICELMTQLSFFEIFLANFKRFFHESGKKVNFFLMTSDDTHEKTLAFFQGKNFSDYVNLHIEKQDNVPSFSDFDLNVNIAPDGSLIRKPHGHGDVHFLIKRSGVLKKWKEEHGVEFVFFFQDTNPFSLPSLPVVLGYAIEQNMNFVFLSVGRKEGEAIGALITDSQGITYNVEYSILQKLLKKAKVPESFDKNGFSNYSGNINCFLIRLSEYDKILGQRMNLKEFVNPKLDKVTKNLTSAFRIESLMQDIVFSFTDGSKIGVVELNRSLAFSTCKNNLTSGKALQEKNLSTETIIEVENDIYYRTLKIMKYVGVELIHRDRKISDEEEFSITQKVLLADLWVKYTPKMFIHPEHCVFIKDARKIFQNVSFDLSNDMAMVLIGPVCFIDSSLGSISLWVENRTGTTINFKGAQITDEKERVIRYQSLSDTNTAIDYCQRMRGYKIDDESKWTRIIIG